MTNANRDEDMEDDDDASGGDANDVERAMAKAMETNDGRGARARASDDGASARERASEGNGGNLGEIYADRLGRMMPRWHALEVCPSSSPRGEKFGTIEDCEWTRPRLFECSVEDFMFDFMRFHHRRGRDWELVWSAIDRVAIRTGKPTDCLHFYKQICALGGFRNRAHAKSNFKILTVFENTFNYYADHTFTDVGNRFLSMYEEFFLEYEEHNSADRTVGTCSLCEGGSYQGTKLMTGLLHPCVVCGKQYHKHCQPEHRFPSCCNKFSFAGVPMSFVCNACITSPERGAELKRFDDEVLRVKHWEDSGTYYPRVFECVARRGRRYNATYEPPTRPKEQEQPVSRAVENTTWNTWEM